MVPSAINAINMIFAEHNNFLDKFNTLMGKLDDF